MRKSVLTIPEIGLIAITRVALGMGIGFLLSAKLDRNARRAAGIALVAFGVLTTFPLAANVFCKKPNENIQAD